MYSTSGLTSRLAMGRSIIGQAALAIASSRQGRCAPICWNAGIHIEEWESPTTDTVVLEAVSPIAHSGCPLWNGARRQPLNNMAPTSPPASPSVGFRFDGTALISADDATAACTCANTFCTAAS